MTNQTWQNVRDLDIDDLAEVGSVDANSFMVQAVGVAFQRLQTKAMQEAAEAQVRAAAHQKLTAEAAVRAAKAAEDTAEFTANAAFWMMLSVFVLAGTSVMTLILTFLSRH